MTASLLVPPAVEARAAPRGRVPVSFGPLALRLLAGGLVLLIPVWIDRRAILLLAAWDLLVLGAWLFDLRRLPPPPSISIVREWSRPLVLGAPQQVRLRVANDGAVAIDLRITDFVAAGLRPWPADATVQVPARATAEVAYDVAPSARGDAEMGFVALRYRSGAGLAERWAAATLPQRVRVYPETNDRRRQSFALIRARQIVIEKRRARAYGLGRDFESLREFQQGDELRDVCWTATARRGRLIARTYQPERSQAVWVVVDSGRLMRARRGRHTNLDAAATAAFALAQVASGAGDRVGLLVYGRRVQQRLAPGRGPAHLRAVLESLAMARHETAEAAHAAAAATILATQKRRALVVWLTDVPESAAVPDVIESASHLVPKHVLVFAVPRPNDVVALAAAVPDSERDLYRAFAAQEIGERRAGLLGQLRQRGAMVVEVDTPELAGAVVSQYLGVKERNLL
jgi:uncharacterized protein (DUF58 family)